MNTYRINFEFTVEAPGSHGESEHVLRDVDWVEADSEQLALVQFGIVLADFPLIKDKLTRVTCVLETN